LPLLDSVAPKHPGWRRHVAAALALASAALLVMAMARPARDEKVPRNQGIIMLAVDVSASMTATDVQPSRIAAATVAARDFVQSIPSGFEVGLVAFDGSARVLSPPTKDHAEVAAAIDRLDTGEGTAAGDAIYAALDSISASLGDRRAGDGNSNGDGREDLAATIVLLSDGTTTVGRPVEEAAQAANDAGVPITTIAYGTDSGEVTIQGEVIPVPADTQTMAAVAQATGGSAFKAGSAEQLESVYKDIQGRVGYATEQKEIGRAFMFVGILLLFAALAAAMTWMARLL
jgi:Ca-activated chloride channel family protein